MSAFNYLEMIDSNYKHCPTALEWEKVNNIRSFSAYFCEATCVFYGIKYPTANLYFPVIAMISVSLKEELMGEDEHKKLTATQMISKFEKYWFEFSEVLAIAIILDPRYKLHLVHYYYTKIYGVMDSLQFQNVHEKLKILFMKYSAFFNTSNFIYFLFYFNYHFLYCYDGKWKCRGKFNLIHIHFLYTPLNIYIYMKFNMNRIEKC
jgi:hypothetical protein